MVIERQFEMFNWQRIKQNMMGNIKMQLLFVVVVFFMFLIVIYPNIYQWDALQIGNSIPINSNVDILNSKVFRVVFVVTSNDNPALSKYFTLWDVDQESKELSIIRFDTGINFANDDNVLGKLLEDKGIFAHRILRLKENDFLNLMNIFGYKIVGYDSASTTHGFDNIANTQINLSVNFKGNESFVESLVFDKIANTNLFMKRFALATFFQNEANTDLSGLEVKGIFAIIENIRKYNFLSISDIEQINASNIENLSFATVRKEDLKVEISNASNKVGYASQKSLALERLGINVIRKSTFNFNFEGRGLIYLDNKYSESATLFLIKSVFPDFDVRFEPAANFSTADIFVILK